MEHFIQLYLPIFLFAFLILVFVVPTLRVYRRTGINPFRFTTNHDKAHDYIGASMKVFILLLILSVCAYSFSKAAYSFLGPFQYLELRFLKILGLALGHISLVCIIIAQYNMRLSWRIGIDYQNGTDLVMDGFLSISRNPILLSLLVGLIGFFFILPNALTFAVFFAAYIVLQITMRLEEDFLEKQHGKDYLEYKSRVRRLL